MHQTGIRPIEARHLEVHSIGVKTITLEKTKTNKPRREPIPLWEPLAADIAERIEVAGLGPSDYLLGGAEPMSFQEWESWRDQIFIPARDHVADELADQRLKRARAYDLCRHSYAAQQLAALMTTKRLSSILGHSEETLIRNYSQELGERQGQQAPKDPEREVIKARKKVARATAAS
jgi:hypothetical protein